MAETVVAVGPETVNGDDDAAALNGGGEEPPTSSGPDPEVAEDSRPEAGDHDSPPSDVKSAKRKRDDVESDEFVGFSSPVNHVSKKRLSTLIEKLEQELLDIDETACKKSKSNKHHKDETSSRPSSVLSSRSDSDATGGTDESPMSSSTRNVSRKASVDLSSPMYRIPFDLGWKRELVFRAASDQQKKQADVYYYAPNGKKLRSTREVLENIGTSGLTIDNFTFYKDPIGLDDPEKEIIRFAKVMKGSGDSPASSPRSGAIEGKRTPKLKGPKGSSPDGNSTGKIKVKSVGSRLSSTEDDSLQHKKTPGRKSSSSGNARKSTFDFPSDLSDSSIGSPDSLRNDDDIDEEFQEASAPVDSETLSQSTRLTESQLPSKDNETTFFNSEVSIQKLPASTTITPTYDEPTETPKGGLEPCSMRCPLAPGEIPDLQCSICLCLYHSRCAGVQASVVQQYICLNCQAAKALPFSATGVPQSSKSGHGNASLANVGPRSTPPRIPQPGLIPVSKLSRIPSNTKIGSEPTKASLKSSKINDWQQHGKSIEGIISQGPPPPKKVNKKDGDKIGKSILGSVAPRLPSSTSIQIIPKQPPKSNQPPVDPSLHQPQMIGIYNGKKYIVVPKHDTLNMSPLSNMTPKQGESAPKLNELPYNIYTGSEQLQNNTPIETELPAVDPTSVEAVKDAIQQFNDNVYDVGDDKKRGRPTKNGKSDNGRGKVREEQKDYFKEFYIANQAQGYDSLVQIFKYLKMRELAAAARVCRLWRDIASTPTLWRSVRMKNSQVNDWEGFVAALKRHGTKYLDLRKMLLPSEVPQATWDQITEQISTVDTLTRIDLCRCSASAVEQISKGLPKLEVLTANSVKCQVLDPSPLALLTDLKELRIKGMNGLTLSADLKCLESLKKLKHLSLTSIKDLNMCGGCNWLSSLTELECLELGEFTVKGQEAAEAFSNLTKLSKLRLERSPVDDGGPTVLKAISKLERLTHLELINFDIKVGFESAISVCTNIKKLLIIPTYVSQSATTNRCVLDGVLRLKSTLTQLVWGITIELMKVTELFIDQCDRNNENTLSGSPRKKMKKAHAGECIPVLKPVPGLSGHDIKATPPGGPPQVEILPLPTLERLLTTELPNTKLKILRIPYHATWRQLLSDND